MLKELSKYVKSEKSKQRNIYITDSTLFNFIFFIFVVVEIFAFIQPLFSNLNIGYQLVVFAVFLLVGIFYGIRKYKYDKYELMPYKREKDFSFLGLFDLSKIKNITESTDIISRNTEVEHIHDTLESIIFPQTERKQLFCLTGQSGCGKSTILSFFKSKYDSLYTFYDFTGDYNFIEGKIQELYENQYKKSFYNNKTIFILDQFERYFFLTDEKKESVRKLLQQLSHKNSAIIVSMREEFLADFLKEFNMNNVAEVKDNNSNGILKPLVSILKEDSGASRFKDSRKANKLFNWQGENIKNNFDIHLQDPDDQYKNVTLERLGVTLFYCENQNNSVVYENNEKTKSSTLKDKCERSFNEKGLDFFESHKNEPLIEQQIIFQMVEFDKKIRNFSDEDLDELIKMNNSELLERYFDIQLSSSHNFFYVSRILYLLSEARLNNISMTIDDIKTGLYIDQFGNSGIKDFNEALKTLEELQLIRKNTDNSDVEYEIAHDFIATAFINYSNSNMNKDVKNALDIFLAEYLDKNSEQNIKRRKENQKKEKSDKYYLVLSYFSAVTALIIDFVQRFFYNPWNLNVPYLNSYNGEISIFIPVISVIAIIYLGQMYDKVMKYYHGPKEKFIRVMYFFLMVLATSSVLFYNHILLIDGLCVVILGLNFAFLLDHNYQETSRSELWGYGIKTMMIGAVYVFAHIMFNIFNPNGLPIYLIFSESVMLFILIVYSHIAHLTKEYLYARLIDVSSTRENSTGI